MTKGWTCATAIAAGLILVGCVGPATQRAPIDPSLAAREAVMQRELAITQLLEDENRLSAVAYRLMTGASDLCGERVMPALGFRAWSAADYSPEYRSLVHRRNKYSDAVHLIDVVDGSPASAAGLKPGDRLVEVAGWSVPEGAGAVAASIERFKDNARVGEPLSLTIWRWGKRVPIVVVPERSCDYGVILDRSDIVNAFADGNSIFITKGMMRFAANDIELATVVAHEIAHNAMGHIDAKKTNLMAGAGVGLIFDVLAAVAGVNTQGGFSKIGAQTGAGAYSQDFEAEADYVGLYIMAQAGMDVAGTANFWRRMAVAYPGSIKTNHAASHPPTPYRYVGLENAAKEINAKLAAGQPLVPEMMVEPPARTGDDEDDATGSGTMFQSDN